MLFTLRLITCQNCFIYFVHVMSMLMVLLYWCFYRSLLTVCIFSICIAPVYFTLMLWSCHIYILLYLSCDLCALFSCCSITCLTFLFCIRHNFGVWSPQTFTLDFQQWFRQCPFPWYTHQQKICLKKKHVSFNFFMHTDCKCNAWDR